MEGEGVVMKPLEKVVHEEGAVVCAPWKSMNSKSSKLVVAAALPPPTEPVGREEG